MHIRLLGSSDANLFQSLRLQALRECPSAFASSYEEECDCALSIVADRLTATDTRGVFGAFEEAELIATAGLVRENKRKLAHKAFIWGVYVAPQVRKRGIGTRLIAYTLQHASSMIGLRQVNLSVNAANTAAIALYRSMGFESFGIERGFMLIDGELHDEMHMVRTFVD